MKETDVGAAVVKWLRRDGWDVYQEVSCRSGVADIVATRDGRVWIVETKTTLSFALIDQARDRLKHAHWVSVAVPSAKRSETAYWALRYFGIGLLLKMDYTGEVRESIEPRTNRAGHQGAKKLISTLVPEQHDFAAAGTAHGGYWTPFKATCRNALDFVKVHGACTAKDLIDGIKHHYRTSATARTTLIQRIEAGVVPGLRIDRSVKPLRVVPEGKKNAQARLL
jgi:hypothetical protein